jgi:acetolactate decarboxylase
MPTLNCDISQSLLDALAARREQTGESTAHIVMAALADALQVEHGTLFQISTTGALVEGVTQGAITVADLIRHGDFGLGTFADFDGEMVVLDGTAYQVTRDGVNTAPDETLVPFAVVAHFLPEKTTEFASMGSIDDLVAQLDSLRNTSNEFFAVRAEGSFKHVKTRAVCKTEGPVSLVDAATRQAEFEFRDVQGVLVGFWSPEYVKSLNVVGWHLHFLTADRLGGGHLLACQGGRAAGAGSAPRRFSHGDPRNRCFSPGRPHSRHEPRGRQRRERSLICRAHGPRGRR